MKYQKHKFNFFPEISGEDFDNLKNSIADGFNEKLGTITVYQNSILDGWNRYRACKETNVKPVYSYFEGTEQQAFEFSIKANQDRRHLSKSQLAVIAIEAEPIWVLIQEQVESDRRRKIAATLEKTLAEKKERERVEALRKIEAIKRENERIEKQRILKERFEAEQDLNKKAKIEAERLWIEKVCESNRLKEVERQKKMRQLIASSSNRNFKSVDESKNTTKLATTFGTNRQYISDAKKLKETNLAEFEAIKRGEKTITQVKKEIKQANALKEYKENRNIDIEAVANENNENVVLGDATKISYPKNISVLITDPPYGVNFISNRRVITPKDEGIINDGDLETALLIFDKALENIYDCLNENSHVFVFINWKYEPEFRLIIQKYFKIKGSLIWVKNNHGSGDLLGSFAPKHERIIHAVKGKPRLLKRIPDVLYGSEFKTNHPTKKPIDLIKQLIEVTTFENELVVDCFGGEGSTAIAAKEINRRFFISEIDTYNYSQIIKNLKNGQ